MERTLPERVIIESPYKGKTPFERARNERYLLECIRDSALRGEAPYASHRMMVASLDEDMEEDREIGIECGYAWWDAATLIVFYTDLGWSTGMRHAYKKATHANKPIAVRRIWIGEV